jgi:hypothetical protein
MYFLEQISSEDQWDISDEFDEICTRLFSSLVLNPVGGTSHKKNHSYEQSPKPLLCLQVVPQNKSGTPIQINREKTKASGYWDYPLKLIKPSDVDLRFVDCFDFDKLGYKNFEYYLVHIVDAPKYPDIIERNALIKAQYVNVFFIDEFGES